MEKSTFEAPDLKSLVVSAGTAVFVSLQYVQKPPGLLSACCHGDLVYLAGNGPFISLSGISKESHDTTGVRQQMISAFY